MNPNVSERSVELVAGELGLDVEGVSAAVAAEVELRMRHHVQAARKMMERLRRRRLTVADVTAAAMRLDSSRSVLGFGRVEARTQLEVVVDGPGNRSEQLRFAALGVEDLAELTSRASSGSLPPAPLKPFFRMHWLAVGGVQPTIAENPCIGNKRARPADKSTECEEVYHSLTRELQLYYDRVLSVLEDAAAGSSTTDAVEETVLMSLSSDVGIQPLVPYFMRYVAEQVRRCSRSGSRSLPMLRAVMRVTRSILRNPHIRTEPYLHQIMPAVLTCLVGKRLSASPLENHWELRDLSASIVGMVCGRFGETYEQLQPRISKTLQAALLDKRRALTTHYGAVVGITAMGPLAVGQLLLPQLAEYLPALESALADHAKGGQRLGDSAASASSEALHCLSALYRAFGLYVSIIGAPITSTSETLADTLAAAPPPGRKLLVPARRGRTPAKSKPSKAAVAKASKVARAIFRASEEFGESVLPFTCGRESYVATALV